MLLCIFLWYMNMMSESHYKAYFCFFKYLFNSQNHSFPPVPTKITKDQLL